MGFTTIVELRQRETSFCPACPLMQLSVSLVHLAGASPTGFHAISSFFSTPHTKK